jgi:transcriptional regulator with XRE-family HTH domain
MNTSVHKRKKRFEKEIKSFGDNLRKIRESKGLTQQGLAGGAGMSFSTLNAIECGRINPTLATILAIAKELKMSPKKMF